jgi:hypothetical protein
MKMVYTLTNGSVTQGGSFEYTVLGNEVIANHNTIKVNITMISEDGSGESLLLWVGSGDGVVYQMIMGGETISYPQSASMGGQFLLIFWAFMGSYNSVGGLQFSVAQNSITMAQQGWVVVSSNPTSVTISGKTYSGYTTSVKNTGDTTNNVASGDLTIVQLTPDRWYYASLKVTLNDGSTTQLQMTELVVK